MTSSRAFTSKDLVQKGLTDVEAPEMSLKMHIPTYKHTKNLNGDVWSEKREAVCCESTCLGPESAMS